MKINLLPAALLLTLATCRLALAQGVEYVEPAKPFGTSPAVQKTAKGDVDPRSALRVPLITWAADGVTVSANGGLAANPNSPLARSVGRPLELSIQDDLEKQVESYISGKSPFLRGTADMIALVSQALKEKDPALEPIVFLQLSTSTGADGFVSIGIEKVADLKGKSIVLQINGPHLSLIGNMLQDAGLSPDEVTLKFVRDITVAPDWNKTGPARDPANALRRDSTLAGGAMIYPDILAVTAGGTIGTGQEGTVKGARPLFSTRTANNVIFDVYAVRRDFLEKNPAIVEGFRTAHLKEQERFLGELANAAKKSAADKKALEEFKRASRPLAKIFMQDEAAVNDYILWVGVDSQLAGSAGNARFFDDKNPVGFQATTDRIQAFFTALKLIKSPTSIAYKKPEGAVAAAAPEPVKRVFATPEAVRGAAESKNSNALYKYTFAFSAATSDISWRDYPEVFKKIHETVTRYGGAVVQLRGHADNFFANFVAAKRKKGEETYQRRVPGTTQFETLPLPKTEQILNDAVSLSYARAFAVKKAYAAYAREALGLSLEEVDLSRFEVRGMGVSDPVVPNPTTPEQRAANMRGELIIIAAEAEIPADFGAGDLK